ncbi:hypothetical protein L596_013231 [Steinernema carpocapsae]|uniref:UPAR/Ly6 domain-containing protein n=1 Tax=Steinernema carpocapsae TaxID=34508 RepID=A0A4U5P0C7_STECR|nr:hypothetical protein L596_013231 [Steinernema carpocapsae]
MRSALLACTFLTLFTFTSTIDCYKGFRGPGRYKNTTTTCHGNNYCYIITAVPHGGRYYALFGCGNDDELKSVTKNHFCGGVVKTGKTDTNGTYEVSCCDKDFCNSSSGVFSLLNAFMALKLVFM